MARPTDRLRQRDPAHQPRGRPRRRDSDCRPRGNVLMSISVSRSPVPASLVRIAFLVVVCARTGYAADSFVLVDTLLDPVPSLEAHFGFSVAALDTSVGVGSPAEDSGMSGAAYLFGGMAGTPLSGGASSAGDRFGFSMAAVGGRIVVGAPFAMVGGEETGAVYVFDG